MRPDGAAGLAAARDLVARTLARHGLAGGALEADGRAARGTGGLAGAGPGGFMAQGSGAFAGPGLAGGMGAFTQRTARGPGAFAPPRPGVEDELPPGARFEAGRFECEAGARDYRLFVPGPAVPAGLVVMLHGCTQTPEDFARGTQMNALAGTRGLAVLYPRQSRGDNAQSCWNWFSRGDQARGRGEPAILAGMTQRVAADLGLPPGRACVAGLSAGGAMAVILGRACPDVFRAVGAHSGLPFGAARDVASAFAAMAGQAGPVQAKAARDAGMPRTIVFHGTADATVHPSNGARIVDDLARAPGLAEVEDHGTAGGRRFVRRAVIGPDGASCMEHWAVEGLGHAWSGGRAGMAHCDPLGPDASAEMLRFFFGDAPGED